MKENVSLHPCVCMCVFVYECVHACVCVCVCMSSQSLRCMTSSCAKCDVSVALYSGINGAGIL